MKTCLTCLKILDIVDLYFFQSGSKCVVLKLCFDVVHFSTVELRIVLPRIKACPVPLLLRERPRCGDIIIALMQRYVICTLKVSSHSYSQLRPVRGDGMTRLASPTHKKHQDKDNETGNCTHVM